MNFNLHNLRAKEVFLQQRMKNGWRMFLFTPARYWHSTLIAFTVIFLIILLADAWLFLRLAHTPKVIPDESSAPRFTLKRKELEHALSLLRERKIEFLQQKETPPPTREVFGTPSAPASGQ